jgi:hypothetical protein
VENAGDDMAGEGIEPPTRGFSVRRFYSVVDIQ